MLAQESKDAHRREQRRHEPGTHERAADAHVHELPHRDRAGVTHELYSQIHGDSLSPSMVHLRPHSAFICDVAPAS